MRYEFDTFPERRNTDCAKWDGGWMQQDEQMLPLWVADMDFRVLPEIEEAIHQTAAHGIYGYHFPPQSYKESVKGWMERRHGWTIDTDWIEPAPGIVPAINAAINAFTQPEDAVLIFSPVYYPFYKAITENDRKAVQFPLTLQDGRYTIDFEALEQTLADEQVKMMVFCSPHNPIGRVWTEQELQKLGELVKKYNILMISDEIHMDLVYPGYRHIPFLKACPELADQTIVCTAPSKTFNIAGLQISSLIIPNETMRTTFHAKSHAGGMTDPGIIGCRACEAAYTHGDAWLDELLEYLKGNLDFVRAFVQERMPEVQLIEPEGLYLVWLDFSALGLTPEQLEELMLKEAHVWLDEGYIFGPGGECFERINIAAPRSLIEEAMERIAKAVDTVRSR